MSDPSVFGDVDVIIPVWTETMDHLEQAIDSLRPYMRPILVFNGPQAQYWRDQIDREQHVITTEDIQALGGGCYLCHARNLGVRKATAPFVAFLDADDLFLPGIDDVVLAAYGRRGAWGDGLVAWANGSEERLRQQVDPPTVTQPMQGTYVLRRDVVPEFDVWARHQRGGAPNFDWWFWRAVTDVDLKYVPTTVMVYRTAWSEQTASSRYRANRGWHGVGEHPPESIFTSG